MDEGLSLKVMLTKCLVFSPSSLDYLLIFIIECGSVACTSLVQRWSVWDHLLTPPPCTLHTCEICGPYSSPGWPMVTQDQVSVHNYRASSVPHDHHVWVLSNWSTLWGHSAVLAQPGFIQEEPHCEISDIVRAGQGWAVGSPLTLAPPPCPVWGGA